MKRFHVRIEKVVDDYYYTETLEEAETMAEKDFEEAGGEGYFEEEEMEDE